jgi:hypothetical protein
MTQTPHADRSQAAGTNGNRGTDIGTKKGSFCIYEGANKKAWAREKPGRGQRADRSGKAGASGSGYQAAQGRLPGGNLRAGE